MPSIYLGNDNTLRLVGLRNDADFSFINDATVTCTLRVADEDGVLEDGTEVTGAVDLAMGYVDPGADDVGGTAASPTVVASVSNLDLTVTVGATTALSLSAGTALEILHKGSIADPITEVWRVARDVSAAADDTAVIHLMPFVYSSETEPTEIEAIAGEPVMICNGIYACTLQNTLDLTKGTTYYAEISVDATSETLQATFYEKLKGAYRL